MEVDGESTEDTVMQDGEGEGEEQRPPFQAEGTSAQETTMQRQKLFSEAVVLEKKEQEQEQMYQKLTKDANALREQEQKRKEQRHALAREGKELLNRKQRQKEQQETLAADASELDESATMQELDERDMAELQRQVQEELADLELPSPLELEYGGINADQTVPEIQFSSC